MNALLATLVGGALAIAGGVVGALAAGRSEMSRWRRDAQLRASTDLLSALQELVRRMIDLSYLTEEQQREILGDQYSAYRDANHRMEQFDVRGAAGKSAKNCGSSASS